MTSPSAPLSSPPSRTTPQLHRVGLLLALSTACASGLDAPTGDAAAAARTVTTALALADAEPAWAEALRSSQWASHPVPAGEPGLELVSRRTPDPQRPSAAAPTALARLAARLAPTADAPLRLHADGAGASTALALRLEDVSAAPWELADGVAVARQALPSTDVLAAARPDAVELFFLLKDPGAPTRWRWTIEPSPLVTLRQAEASVVIDIAGQPPLRL